MCSEQDQRSSRRGAFTLLEMMVVLVIIGLLAGVVTVNVRYFMTQGKQKTTRVQMAAFRQALDTFYTACGRYPRTEEGLEILTQKSDKMPEALLRQIPLDPWGRGYQYVQPGRHEPFEIISFGADGAEGGSGEDADISSEDLDQAKKAAS